MPGTDQQRQAGQRNLEERARLVVRLATEGLGDQEFSPLVPPVSFDMDRLGVDADLVRRLHCRFQAQLQAGRIKLPLIADQVFPVDVPQGCQGRGWVAAERSSDDPSEARITSAALSFDPPLVLHNIVPVLARLNSVFKDHELGALLGRLRRLAASPTASAGVHRLRRSISGRLRPRLDRWLPPDTPERQVLHELRTGLQHGSERVAQVELRHVSARPVLRGDSWLLDLRFTGLVQVLGRAPVPFEDLHVPYLVIPYPYASLARLMSGKPLATAQLRTESIPTADLAITLAQLLVSLRGNADLHTDLPAVEVHAHLPDGGTLRSELQLPEPARVRLRFAARVQAEQVQVELEDVAVDLDGDTLGLEGQVGIRVLEPPGDDPRSTVMGCCALAAVDGGWPADKLRLSLSGRLRPGSSLASLDARVSYTQPVLRGGVDAQARLEDLRLEGSGAIDLDPETGQGRTQSLSMSFASGFRVLDGSYLDDGTTLLRLRQLEGSLSGSLQASGAAEACLELEGRAQVRLEGATRVSALPELDIDDGELLSQVRAGLSFQGRASSTELDGGPLELDFGGSRLELDLQQVKLELGSRQLELPAGSSLVTDVVEGVLDTTGLGRARVGVAYDLRGQSPVLRGSAGQVVEPLVAELRSGELELAVNAVGGLSISGPEGGLYDARYFNALINPDQELERWFELLASDEALDHVIDAVRVFTDEGADLLEQLRSFARRVDAAMDAEGVEQPADAIPGPTLARLLSRILVEGPELQGRILPLVEQVTDGDGLDVIATKRLLDEVLPPHEYGFEVDRTVRWLAQVLGPTEPLAVRAVKEQPSLAEQPGYVALFSGLPPAGEIYGTVMDSAPLPAGFAQRVARVAPYLSLVQLDWLIAQDRDDWGEVALARLGVIRAIKQRVRAIAESYGGLGYAPQAMAIAMFLPPSVKGSAGLAAVRVPGEPSDLLVHPDCLLGPDDVAVLLQAGLAAALQGRVVQHNQRLLLDLVFHQPPAFARQVLVEMCQNSPRILVSELNALLALEQGALRQPLDLVRLLSERLGVQIPRLDDFLAGGRRARHSYYEALNTAADVILAEAEPARALRTWLQVRRVPVPDNPSPPRELVRSSRAAIRDADALGRACTFTGREVAKRRRARQAYERAFAACTELLAEEPRAFQLPWLRSFWARNYDALVLLSVVRNAQQRVDRVREWLVARSGRPVPRAEQALLDAVIDVLYAYPADRRALKGDPLVRLLMDPPPGRYDFTIVSAMGVVTEGAAGRELEDAFSRLYELRGVSVVRADTATARSLDYNAQRVEEAVRGVSTPWGWIGYSQGCANGLWTESCLVAGTPEQQALLAGLRCRHLLFSATNGSAHGGCGDLKFLRAMVDGDRFLSHYQALFSRQAIQVALRAIRQLLDAPVFVKTMGGVDSLSSEGVLTLGREGQFLDTAPTTITRGVVRQDYLPEALELLSNVLTRQVETEEHDTQVTAHEAVGHPVHVDNAWARRMRACDIGCRVQSTHHWSPLLYTVEFITTERDRERCIYDFPKDRHVFPWVEINARFGVIERVR